MNLRTPVVSQVREEVKTREENYMATLRSVQKERRGQGNALSVGAEILIVIGE